jgi:hypothetical protein
LFPLNSHTQTHTITFARAHSVSDSRSDQVLKMRARATTLFLIYLRNFGQASFVLKLLLFFLFVFWIIRTHSDGNGSHT